MPDALCVLQCMKALKHMQVSHWVLNSDTLQQPTQVNKQQRPNNRQADNIIPNIVQSGKHQWGNRSSLS